MYFSLDEWFFFGKGIFCVVRLACNWGMMEGLRVWTFSLMLKFKGGIYLPDRCGRSHWSTNVLNKSRLGSSSIIFNPLSHLLMTLGSELWFEMRKWATLAGLFINVICQNLDFLISLLCHKICFMCQLLDVVKSLFGPRWTGQKAGFVWKLMAWIDPLWEKIAQKTVRWWDSSQVDDHNQGFVRTILANKVK